MGSHVLLAQRYDKRPNSNLAEWFSGAVAPDVRYVQSGLGREVTHSWEFGQKLNGAFGAGYRHHLAVDRAFYRRCETHSLLRRLGAMNSSILAELFAIRRIGHVPQLCVPLAVTPLWEIGVDDQALNTFFSLSGRYLTERDPGLAIRMLTGPLRERAAQYLDKWQKWGSTLQTVASVAAPLLEQLFVQIRAEAEGFLERES